MKIIKLISFLILLLSSFSSFASFPIERTKNGEIVLYEQLKLDSQTINKEDIGIFKVLALLLTLPFIYGLGYFGFYSFYMGHRAKFIIQLILLPFAFLLGFHLFTLATFGVPFLFMDILGLIVFLIYLFVPLIDFFRILIGHLKPAKGYYFD